MIRKLVLSLICVAATSPVLILSSCNNNDDDAKIEGIENYSAYLEPDGHQYYYSCMEIIFSENLKEGWVHALHFDISVDISGKKLKSKWGAVEADHYEYGWIRVITISDSIYKYNYSLSFSNAVLQQFVIEPI